MLLELGPEGCHQPLSFSTIKVCVWCGPAWLSELLCSEFNALISKLFKGRKLPDAAILQEWLNVLNTAPVWGVGQVPADAAVFLDSTAFTVLRDE